MQWLRLHPYLGRGRKLLCRVRSGDGVLAVSARLGTRWISGSDGSCLAVCVHVMAWMGRWGRCGFYCLEIMSADGDRCPGCSWTSIAGIGREPADGSLGQMWLLPLRWVSSQLGYCHGAPCRWVLWVWISGRRRWGRCHGGASDRSVAHLAIDLSLIADMLIGFPNS
ncbi:hypothetical protein ACLOJK_004644 [Asimina triloba]